jgi:signal transduction histidine kinase
MVSFFDQVFSILTTAPGNLAYHLVLAFTIAATFQISLPFIKRANLPHGRRLVAALAFLLFVRLLLFLVSILTWQSISPIPETHLALLDRTITALSLVVIVWLWAFPDPSPPADKAFAFLGTLTFLFLILSALWWPHAGQLTPFNSSPADVLWQTFTIFLIFLGGILLVVRLPVGWGIGLVFMTIMFIGHLIHLVSPVLDADYAGVVRLAQLAAYPLLFFLPQRFPITLSKPLPANHYADTVHTNTSRNQKIIHSIRDLATHNNPSRVYPALTHTIAHLMSSEVCLLLSTDPPNERIYLRFGYDFIRQETIPEITFKYTQLPQLAKALLAERPLRLSDSETVSDQVGLGSALNLSTSGPVLSVPLLDSHGKSHLSIVLLSPYSDRWWDEQDEEFLTNLTASFAPALVRTRQFQELENQIEQLKQAVHAAEARASETSQLNQTLITQLSALQENVSQEQSRTEGLAALISTHYTSADDEDREASSEFNLDLKSSSLSSKVEQPDNGSQSLQEDLRLAQEEITHLKASLSAARDRISSLADSSSTAANLDRRNKAINTIAQEIRLPLSSIIGYTEVLLTRSGASLSTSQRKVLERIKISTQRLVGLLEDLAQVTVTQSRESSSHPLSLLALIEETIALSHQSIRRKQLAIKTDIPEKLPQVMADRHLLRQLILYIIREATKATLSGNSISFIVRDMDPDIPPDTVLLQISDNGPAIPPAELSQVFNSTEYPTESATDDAAQLSIAAIKRQFESQGGRVWVDSTEDQGTTFSLLLPVYLPSHLAFPHQPKSNEDFQ